MQQDTNLKLNIYYLQSKTERADDNKRRNNRMCSGLPFVDSFVTFMIEGVKSVGYRFIYFRKYGVEVASRLF